MKSFRMKFGGAEMRRLLPPQGASILDRIIRLNPSDRTVVLSHILAQYERGVREGALSEHHFLAESVAPTAPAEPKPTGNESSEVKARASAKVDSSDVSHQAEAESLKPETAEPMAKLEDVAPDSEVRFSPRLAHLVG